MSRVLLHVLRFDCYNSVLSSHPYRSRPGEHRSSGRRPIQSGGEPPIPVISFFGLTGRSDAAHAALLLIHAKVGRGTPCTLVRMLVPGEARLPPAPSLPNALRVVEREVAAEPHVAFVADEEIAAALALDRDVVLDLPFAVVRHEALRARLDVAVAVVGPTPLDEHAAICALEIRLLDTPVERAIGEGWASPDARAPSPVRLLGSGRSGGIPAADAFNRRIGVHGPSLAARGLPVVVPVPSPAEASALFEGSPLPASLEVGEALTAVLAIVAERPRAEIDELAGLLDREQATRSLRRDRRTMAERLRELSDELQAIEDGVRPTPEELAGAPTLEEWEVVPKIVPALTGRVFGHPDFPAGRRITTSDLYASDGTTFARTMSRLYALARPAGADGRPD